MWSSNLELDHQTLGDPTELGSSPSKTWGPQATKTHSHTDSLLLASNKNMAKESHPNSNHQIPIFFQSQCLLRTISYHPPQSVDFSNFTSMTQPMPPRFLSLPELLEVRASGCAQDVAGVGSSRNLGELIYKLEVSSRENHLLLEVSSRENHLQIGGF